MKHLQQVGTTHAASGFNLIFERVNLCFGVMTCVCVRALAQEAEKMVASLQDTSLEEECFTQTLQESRNTAAALPLSHEAAMKWFYKDPQGEIQGTLAHRRIRRPS